MFDPECHRQVLGNRQEAKEQKTGRKEGESQKKKKKAGGGGGRRPVLQGKPDSVATTAKEVGPRLHRGQNSDFLPLPRLTGPVNNLMAVIYNSTA